jgi:hypothetical protein
MVINSNGHDDAAPAASEDNPGSERTDRLLRALAEKLQGRGLEASLATYPVNGVKGSHFDKVLVTNPAAPERGTVHVEKGGLVTWEYFTSLDGEAGAARVLDDVTNVLRGAGERFRQ